MAFKFTLGPSFKQAFDRFLDFWNDSHCQAWNDVSTRWKHGAFWFLFATLCDSFIMIYLSLYVHFVREDAIRVCLPDESFSLYPQFQYWSKSGFFDITIGFGNLTFSQAKIIDVIWDIVFGRGGQALLAFSSWQVFTRFVTTSMETRPIAFRTYRNFFLQDQSLVLAIPRTIYDFSSRSTLSSRLGMIFIIFTMSLTLAFPTLGSAMTGYKGNTRPFVRDKDDNYISFDSYKFVLYIVHDGWRINKTSDLIISYILTDDSPYHMPTPYAFTWDYLSCETNFYQQNPDLLEDCFLTGNVSEYVAKNGFYGMKQEASTFRHFDVPSPVLNISAMYLPNGFTGYDWTDPITQEKPFNDQSRIAWTVDNQTYDLDYIKEKGTCQTVENYQWGFSFMQLNVVIILLLIWAIGIYSMWITSHFAMKNRGITEVAGEQKAIFELANAMNEQLARHMKNLPNQTEASISKCIAQDLHGGKISYRPQFVLADGSVDRRLLWELKSWLMKAKWWFIALLFLSAGAVSAGIFIYNALAHTWTIIGTALTFAITIPVGTSNRSRGILFFCSVWIFNFLPVLILALYDRGRLLYASPASLVSFFQSI